MAPKRKNEGQGAGSSKVAKSPQLVQATRWRELNAGDVEHGPVLYWMSRDQRMQDNWALLHAAEVASANNATLTVCFNLVTEYLGAGARQFGFMLRGLKELAPKLEKKNIHFHLLQGEAKTTVPKLVKELGATLLVTDFSPARLARQWRKEVANNVACPFHEVDAHNVVPVWEASDKREYGARTIRAKIHRQLPTYLEEFPALPALTKPGGKAPDNKWDAVIKDAVEKGKEVPEVSGFLPGEDAAHAALTGKGGFLPDRLKGYKGNRNDPNQPEALSNLSPYFHFGQLSAQRAALEATKHKKVDKDAVEGFLEEAVVRRELSDNYCFYEPNYDSIEAASGWAQESLEKHKSDKREHVYRTEQFENAETHDELWNAAQNEMVHLGKMHGFMRMYWAKKILEWSESPEDALATAIYLNDKYELDGRDPNGWVGCMWSICGIHDQGWAERDVFGKVRYMNYNGCKRKFDIEAYQSLVQKRIGEEAETSK